MDPEWWRTGVVYQIYPRSFADSDGDGLGDLAGILEHLDHLNDGTPRSLGVEAIWLSPIYPSPDFDFGYDVADYLDVDPRFGNLETFGLLVSEAHRRGIRVILDLVLNHTSYRHPWFLASQTGRDGPKSDWYVWADPRGRSRGGRPRPPNNWRSWFGGSAWAWDPSREQFYLHTFLPEQPDLNWRNAGVYEAMFDVVRTWLARGVDGFRLDVFNLFFKDAALRSNPRRVGGRNRWSWQRHVFDRNQPELLASLVELRAIVDERTGRTTVGELFDGTVEDAAAYTQPGHLVFDFSLLAAPWSAAAFRRAIARREAAFGPRRWPTNVLSNHDQPRHASRYDDGAHGDARAKVAAALLLTLRGTPFLYYGEEIAQRNIVVPPAEAFDPPARRATLLSPWWNRDQARAPMAWTAAPNGGFSSVPAWLRLSPDADRRNVAMQAADPGSVLSFYRRLLAVRRASPALHAGSFELVQTDRDDVLAYLRRADTQSALILLNFAARPETVVLPTGDGEAAWRTALSTHRTMGGHLGGSIELQPDEALILLAG
jgi:alpha-glucosidase